MTGNDDDLNKEWTMKTIWTMTTTTKNKRRNDNKQYVDSNSTNKDEGKQYYEEYLSLCICDRQSQQFGQGTDSEDDLDNDNKKEKAIEGTTMRNMLTVIIQMMMRASDIMKYIYPYVFMTGNDDDLDNCNNNKKQKKE